MPPPNARRDAIETIAILLPLAVGVAVAFIPNLVYAPIQKVAIFFLLGLCPAVLLADKATTRFQLKLPGMVFTAGGAAAILFGLMFWLDRLSKPEEQIALYEIFDASGNPYPLQVAEFEVHRDRHTALTPSYFTDRNTIILIFPQQLPEADISIKDPLTQRTVRGTVSYTGSRTNKLTIGKELK
jgi:hypothetical protein